MDQISNLKQLLGEMTRCVVGPGYRLVLGIELSFL